MKNEFKIQKIYTQRKPYLLLLGFILLVLTACSEKSSKNTLIPGVEIAPLLATQADAEFILPAQGSVTADTVIVYKGEETPAVKLCRFINKNILDEISNTNNESRRLFTYELIGSDGFTPRKSENDLLWINFKDGFLLPEKSFRGYFEYFDNLGIGTYNVKDLAKIKAYRTIIVVKADGEEVFFQLKSNSITKTEILNYHDELENAIALKSFITDYITKTPQNYIYRFEAVDAYTMDYEWSLIEAGYWLINTERTSFPNIEDLPNNQRRFRNLMKISLISK